jgi:glutathione S-transferase
MLRIYGAARSRGVRTLWIAGELGLQYEHLDYAPRSPATRTPEYLALNPNGRVPTIDDDGFVLSQSMAINLYLAKKHGKLYPADARHEALAWQWSFWEVDRLDRQQTLYATTHRCCPRRSATPLLPSPHGRRSRRRSTCWRRRWASRPGSPAPSSALRT